MHTKHCIMKNTSSLIDRWIIVLFVGLTFVAYSQQNEGIENNKLRLEIEPGLFFNNGRSVNGLYSVSNDNNFSVGLYMMATDIPLSIGKNMFDNLKDTSHLRVTKELAFNFRYRVKVFKKYESNPYVGLLLAWEEIKITNPNYDNLEVSTLIATPHIGFEIYLYKQMIYLNPQLRSAFYFNEKKTDETRTESLKPFLILPSISFGLRL